MKPTLNKSAFFIFKVHMNLIATQWLLTAALADKTLKFEVISDTPLVYEPLVHPSLCH